MSEDDLWEKAIRRIWAAQARLDDLDLFGNPIEVAKAVWDLVQSGWEVATSPPEGDPKAVDAAAGEWSALASALTDGAWGMLAQRTRIENGWEGTAADAAVSTVVELERRLQDGAAEARTAASGLRAYATAMGAARHRHAGVRSHLESAGEHARIGPGDVLSGHALDEIRSAVKELRAAFDAAVGSYRDAADATVVCRRVLERVADEMPFPTAAPGISAFELIGAHTPGVEERPLAGDTAVRAGREYDALGAADRAAVDALLDGAPSPDHRAWILAALAGGASLGTLSAFAAHIGQLPAGRLSRALDPTAQRPGVLQQQTSTTCGSASLVVARMLADPVYALRMLDGYDAGAGKDVGGDVTSRFREEEQAVKGRTNDASNGDGGPSVPWPSAVGTPPWGASEEMNHGAGVDGSGYHVSSIDSDSPASRAKAYDDLARSVDDGRAAPLYIGDGLVPRHVVLVVGSAGDELTIYDPAIGDTVTVSRDVFVSGDLGVAGWNRPWAAVVPA